LKQAIIELKQEGIRNRYSRYANSWIVFTEALKEMNLKYLVNDDYHSKLITSVIIHENIKFDDMHDYFYEKGFTIYPSKIEDLNSFRVANIGEIDSNDMLNFVKLLKDYSLN
jgi:2-aminoethylphosphonate-pyruvate transaminase